MARLSSRKPRSGYPGSITTSVGKIRGCRGYGSRLSLRSAGMAEDALLRLAQRRVREEGRVENIGTLRLGVLELVGERDLVDRLVEPILLDAAVAVLLHLGREDVVAQRDLQALELHILFRDVVP